MGIFLSYLFLGLSLAAPIGPINAAQLDRGIKNGFMHSWMVGVGATVADMVYMIAVYMGVVQFLEIPIVKTFLWLFGFFILVYTGVECIVGVGKMVSESRKQRRESITKSFLSGFFMSLSNPLTVLFWLGIYGSILAKTVHTYDTNQLLLYSSAIFSGIILWDITMALLASTFRKYLTTTILAWISIASGLSLIGFGLYFGYEAFEILFF
ncbi:LysE family translocator [Bacillus sp. V3B]|uniref:LysE family translocator n=1 Tax=Bacillus sp. V3B TaxID=2804915 RepID=UPI00210ECEF7|nr:LysE family translocator [Bacillus sp. V3B]MCQ6276253.1 LysE family translocator [Bacillus sp. V3B]